MRRVHARLREALRVTREAVDHGESAETPARELLLFCHGFCSALDAHHTGEDRTLFPAIEAARPDALEKYRRQKARQEARIKKRSQEEGEAPRT